MSNLEIKNLDLKTGQLTISRKSKLTYIRSLFVFALPILFLITSFFPSDQGNILLSLCSFILFLLYLPIVKGFAKIVALLLVGMGILVLSFYHAQPHIWLSSFSKNTDLLSLFLLVPLLGIPLRLGGYLDSIEYFFTRYISTMDQSYILTLILTYIMAIIMNLGAVPFIYQMTNFSRDEALKKVRVIALSRGFILSIFWSPYFVSVALVTSYFKIKWIEILPIGFFMSTIGFVIGWIVFRLSDRMEMHNPIKKKHFSIEVEKMHHRKLWGMLSISLIMVVSIFFLERLWHISNIAVVSFVSLLLPFIYGLITRKFADLKIPMIAHFYEIAERMKVEILLFTSAGFFAQTILLSNIGHFIPEFFSHLGIMSPLGISSFIVLTTILLSIIGIHPVVIVGTLSAALSTNISLLSINHLLAFTLIGCWAISVIVSPFSGLNLSLSGISGVSANIISFYWNRFYTFLITLLIIILGNMFQMLFWS
jgi:DcuC family C4-dicarboxylate transporter